MLRRYTRIPVEDPSFLLPPLGETINIDFTQSNRPAILFPHGDLGKMGCCEHDKRITLPFFYYDHQDPTAIKFTVHCSHS